MKEMLWLRVNKYIFPTTIGFQTKQSKHSSLFLTLYQFVANDIPKGSFTKGTCLNGAKITFVFTVI
jgi:hypothetical protein